MLMARKTVLIATLLKPLLVLLGYTAVVTVELDCLILICVLELWLTIGL